MCVQDTRQRWLRWGIAHQRSRRRERRGNSLRRRRFFPFLKTSSSRFVLRKEPRVGPAHSRGDQWHPMGSRGQRPAPLEISSGLVADFLSADGGEGEGGKKTTTTTFLFCFPFIFPYLLSSFSCLVLFTRESRSRYRRQYTAEKRKRKRRRETGETIRKVPRAASANQLVGTTCVSQYVCIGFPFPISSSWSAKLKWVFFSPTTIEREGKKQPPPGCLI